MNGRPSVLVADPDVRGRLWVMDALRTHCQLSIPGPGEEPLRAVRRVHPQAILLAVPRGRGAAIHKLCRAIKTDSLHPPLVGIVDQWGRLRNPQQLMDGALVDGYLGGRLLPEDVRSFLTALMANQQPMVTKAPPTGMLRRWMNRKA